LSIHPESGLAAENMKQNKQEGNIFQIYKVTNAREVLQLQEKVKQKYKQMSKESEDVKRGNRYSRSRMFRENKTRFYRHLAANSIGNNDHLQT